jgi:5-methylcytosine-specific restriction endonuclease McrA
VRLAELVDHYIPLRCGGTDAEENLVSMCAKCHARKTRDDRRKYKEYWG